MRNVDPSLRVMSLREVKFGSETELIRIGNDIRLSCNIVHRKIIIVDFVPRCLLIFQAVYNPGEKHHQLF